MHFPMRVLFAHSHSTAIQSLVAASSLSGTVQSVFSRAANLQFGRRLITLHAYATPCAPNGIILPAAASSQPFAGLQARLAVIIEDGALYFPNIPLGLCLQQSQPWNPRPSITPAACPTAHQSGHLALCLVDTLAENLTSLARLLLENGPKESLAQLVLLADYLETSALPDASLLVQKAWSSTRRLMQAIAQQQLEPAVRAAETLIGLGPGLTPAGDDLLTGLIAAAVLLSETLGIRPDFYQQFGTSVLKRAQDRTTLLSANWIEYATRGEVSQPLGCLLQALVVPAQPQRLEALAGEVLASGATSGADLLAGVILGSQCLLAQP